MEKYQNKYRISSIRLQGYDYGQNGAYFITICTKNRINYFGEVVDKTMNRSGDAINRVSNGTMQLNELGKLAEKFWFEISDHFPFVEFGNFVVMPNHTHGILIINKPEEMRLIASPRLIASQQKEGGATGNYNPMLHENISRIIRWYKGRCSFEMRKIEPCFQWQSLFHDHIIRNAKSFENIQNYIATNPKNWKKDKFKD